MIYQEPPKYPLDAKHAGITGMVWIKALVDKEGKVRQAIVGTSSGYASLDAAAVAAAYHNRYIPGYQNGRPVALWIKYKVDFRLNE